MTCDVVMGHIGILTLKGQHLLGMDHDAELQNQLRGAFKEGLEQTQHADIGTLKHHAPVVVTALGVSVPPTLYAQIQSVDVPVRVCVRNISVFSTPQHIYTDITLPQKRFRASCEIKN